MRVLIVDEEIIAGGVDTLRRQLTPALARLVEAIVWVLPGHATEGFREVAKECKNVTIETLNSPGGIARVREGVARRIRNGMPRKLVDERLRRLARLHRCDVCLTTCVFSQEMPGVELPLAGFVSDVNPALPQSIRDNIGEWIEKSAATFAVSDFTASELKKLKAACSEKIHSIPLACPGGIKPSGKVIKEMFFYPAAPNEHKGHLVLLEAVRLLAGRGINCRLTLTGAGMDEFARGGNGNEVIDRMRTFLTEHHEVMDGRVTVAGDAGPAELERLFAEASCVVLPSMYEGFGLPLGEALARGKRVICADIAPFREQIARYGCKALATFVPPGNAAALAAAMAGKKQAALAPADLAKRLNRWTWADAARRCHALLEAIHG